MRSIALLATACVCLPNLLSAFLSRPCKTTRLPLSPPRRSTAADENLQQVTEKKPIILLDVDGIINCMGEWGSINKIWPDTLTAENVHGYNIVYSPTVVAKINKWSEVAEVKWLTSWGPRARDFLAPRLGLNAFSVLPYDNKAKDNNNTKVSCAEEVAKEMDPDRLLIWLDDDFKLWIPITYNHDSWQFKEGFANHNGHCLTPGEDCRLRPNSLYISPYCGLTPNHLALVDKYLANPALAKGLSVYELDKEEEDGDTPLGSRTKIFNFKQSPNPL